MKKPVATKRSPITVRLPPDLYDEIKAAVDKDGGSMSGEINRRLRDQAASATLRDITRQNVRTQEMIQRLIDTLC